MNGTPDLSLMDLSSLTNLSKYFALSFVMLFISKVFLIIKISTKKLIQRDCIEFIKMFSKIKISCFIQFKKLLVNIDASLNFNPFKLKLLWLQKSF